MLDERDVGQVEAVGSNNHFSELAQKVNLEEEEDADEVKKKLGRGI